MWGTTGIGFDADRIKAVMPDAPTDSWSLVFDPAVVSRFKDCGVSFLDDPTDMVGTVLLWLGKDPNSQSEADLKLAEEALMKVRPYVRTIHSSQYIEDLANGSICIAVGYSGDVMQARDRAAEAGKPIDIRYSIRARARSCGSTCSPSRAMPGIRATRTLSSITCCGRRWPPPTPTSSATRPPMRPRCRWSTSSLRNDPGVFPTPEVKARLQPNLAKSAEFTRQLNRAWTRFVTGR